MRGVIQSSAILLTVVACQDATAPRSSVALNEAAAVTAEDAGALASSHQFAVVDISGGLVTGNLVAGTTRLGPGQYEVTFTTNVSGCAYIATTVNQYSQAIQAYTAGGHLSANGVYVETKNQGGGLTDGAFHLIVSCGTTGVPFAVVGYSANLVRASAGATMNYLGSGRYEIVFPSSVAPCAYVATVADPSNALVFSPSGVYTGSSANPNAVYIETKNPGGGLQDGVPFHLAVVCAAVQKTRFAVVKAGGVLQRGNVSTTSAKISTGRYTVTTNRNVASTCAVVATRGSPNTGVPFSPATVEVVAGPNANSIGVQVRNLLFFGNTFINQAFHTAMLCT